VHAGPAPAAALSTRRRPAAAPIASRGVWRPLRLTYCPETLSSLHSRTHAGRTPARPRFAVARASEAPDAADTNATAAPTPPADPRLSGLKVFVAGAAGGTGAAVVRALRAKGVPVRALVRDAAAAAGKLPPPGEGLEVVEGDGAY
jgi:hypothetical protein